MKGIGGVREKVWGRNWGREGGDGENLAGERWVRRGEGSGKGWEGV